MLDRSITSTTSMYGKRFTIDESYLWWVPGITTLIGLLTRMQAELPT